MSPESAAQAAQAVQAAAAAAALDAWLPRDGERRKEKTMECNPDIPEGDDRRKKRPDRIFFSLKILRQKNFSLKILRQKNELQKQKK